MKICREIPNLTEMGQKCRALYMSKLVLQLAAALNRYTSAVFRVTSYVAARIAHPPEMSLVSYAILVLSLLYKTSCVSGRYFY